MIHVISDSDFSFMALKDPFSDRSGLWRFWINLFKVENQLPPTKRNKLMQYEISSSAVQANSSHAWVHKCMGAQKKRKESACLAFELISYGVSLFSFVGGNVFVYQSNFPNNGFWINDN